MQKYSIAKCSEIAGLRSKIIAAGYITEPKISKKKQQLAVATSILYQAQSAVLSIIEPIEARLEEARNAIRQLLGVAYHSNIINKQISFNQMIQTLWSDFSTHEQLRGVVANILILVNQSDALRILSEEIDISMLKK